MDKENEQLSIQVRNQVIQEKALIKVDDYITFIFKTILTCFSTSLFIQVVNLLPSSYQLTNQLPLIVSILVILTSMVLIVINKLPTLKTYLLVISAIIGLLMGA